METYRSPPFDLLGYVAFTVKYEDGSKKTVLEHREVMEQTLGRKLGPNEIVHHIDEDKQNNDPSNLEVTTKKKHAETHQSKREEEWIDLVCIYCGKQFRRRTRHERHNRKQGKRGPCCGRSYAARGSSSG